MAPVFSAFTQEIVTAATHFQERRNANTLEEEKIMADFTKEQEELMADFKKVSRQQKCSE